MTRFADFLVIALIWTAAGVLAEEECDKTKCKGPLKFYEGISCTPIYKNEGDCCPHKYNCDHLKERSTNKCYINGHEYNIGESLRDEDANPCDIGCFCAERLGVAGFVCAVVDCFARHQPGCYNPRNATRCCAGSPICPEKPEDWPTCVVNGETYKAGQHFSPPGEPDKNCYCGAGYTGENVEPFCRVANPSICGIELRHAYEIHNNCPPSYYFPQSPQTDCPVAYRCQNDKDQVIKPEGSTSAESKSGESREEQSKAEDMQCKFGTLKMRLGEELNQSTDYSSVCVKCICEVPPVPTCQRLSDDTCDVTNHPPFLGIA